MTDVYRLPPEPPVGTVVEVLKDGGSRLRRVPYFWEWVDTGEPAWRSSIPVDGGLDWSTLLRLAGPDGVRVVEEGQ